MFHCVWKFFLDNIKHMPLFDLFDIQILLNSALGGEAYEDALPQGFPRKSGKLLEFYLRPGIFGMISQFMLVLTQ